MSWSTFHLYANIWCTTIKKVKHFVCEMHVSEDIIMWMCLFSYTMFVHVIMLFTVFLELITGLITELITVYFMVKNLTPFQTSSFCTSNQHITDNGQMTFDIYSEPF